jgi:diguanylate cyclase (GGDEF)-like protein
VKRQHQPVSQPLPDLELTDEINTTNVFVGTLTPTAVGKPRRPCLLAVSGPQRGSIFTIEGPERIIGRTAECDIMLSDSGISRQHAVIRVRPDGTLMLRDLGSRNGTRLNGKRVSESVIEDGDTIRLGEATKLTLTWTDQAQETILRSQYDQATRDTLTGCYRRHYFMEELSREALHAKRSDTPLSVMFIDIDYFKRLNDTYGHVVGDDVLRQVGGMFLSMIRRSDVVARYGGEEFVVLLRNTTLEAAHHVAERWREAVNEAVLQTDAGPLGVTVSIGVSCNQDAAARTPDDLIRIADSKLYAAKQAGRNRVMSV